MARRMSMRARSRIARDETRAPGEVERLDERDGVALRVGRRDGDGVAPIGPGRRRRHGALHTDARAEPPDPVGREQILRALLHPGRIGQIAVAVLEGELGRLDQEMHVVGLAEPSHVEAVGKS